MTTVKAVLIFGAGPRIGASVARKFAGGGFKIALASRSMIHDSISPEGYLQLRVDLKKPSSVPEAFELVKSRFGVPPTVVVYNGIKLVTRAWGLYQSLFIGAHRPMNPPDEPFSAPLDTVKASITVGFESQYEAAQAALRGFAELPISMAKTFIFTGNTLNQLPAPHVFAFALSKRAAAALIEYGAAAYGPKGYRFYYADERNPVSGRPAGLDVDGDAHADMYWQLAQAGKQEQWLVTFAKGKGRVSLGDKLLDFDGTVFQRRY